jgi:heme oxygenase (biliverdin-IX-beta and delta-forming)
LFEPDSFALYFPTEPGAAMAFEVLAVEELKRGTQDLHRRVEQVVDIDSVCAGADTYCALLSRLLGYYEPLEQLLSSFSWDTAGLDFAARRKSAWLMRDLAFLGIDEAKQAKLPRCEELPKPGSLAAALGVMYVLEGATLGGQVIRRTIDKKLRLTMPAGAGFHTSYGPRNGSMWLSFKAAATRQLNSRAQIDEAVHAARETFVTYEAWLHKGAQDLVCESKVQRA